MENVNALMDLWEMIATRKNVLLIVTIMEYVLMDVANANLVPQENIVN